MASPSVEDYIKAIYTAQNAATHVTTQELAERMRVSAPAVSNAMAEWPADLHNWGRFLQINGSSILVRGD